MSVKPPAPGLEEPEQTTCDEPLEAALDLAVGPTLGPSASA